MTGVQTCALPICKCYEDFLEQLQESPMVQTVYYAKDLGIKYVLLTLTFQPPHPAAMYFLTDLKVLRSIENLF